MPRLAVRRLRSRRRLCDRPQAMPIRRPVLGSPWRDRPAVQRRRLVARWRSRCRVEMLSVGTLYRQRVAANARRDRDTGHCQDLPSPPLPILLPISSPPLHLLHLPSTPSHLPPPPPPPPPPPSPPPPPPPPPSPPSLPTLPPSPLLSPPPSTPHPHLIPLPPPLLPLPPPLSHTPHLPPHPPHTPPHHPPTLPLHPPHPPPTPPPPTPPPPPPGCRSEAATKSPRPPIPMPVLEHIPSPTRSTTARPAWITRLSRRHCTSGARFRAPWADLRLARSKAPSEHPGVEWWGNSSPKRP